MKMSVLQTIYPKSDHSSQFADMALSSKFFDIAVFFLSSLVTGLNFMSISLLALELWQFSFLKD